MKEGDSNHSHTNKYTTEGLHQATVLLFQPLHKAMALKISLNPIMPSSNKGSSVLPCRILMILPCHIKLKVR